MIAGMLVWDNHGCLPLRYEDDGFLPGLARYRAAGVDVVSINIGFDVTSIETNLRILARFRDWIARHEDYVLVHGVADIHAARAAGKLAVMFDIEGMGAVGDQLSLVSLYYDLGVRWMLIAYNRNNAAGGGCQDDDGGLTPFGMAILDEMARVGMVACCSHAGARTAMQVMERASAPVILSHSNPSAVWAHPRNVSDALIRACAATGGVIGINGVGPFLGPNNDIGANLILAHIDHAVGLVGPDHVGLGLDYCFDESEVDAYIRENPASFPAELGYAGGMRFAPPETIPLIADGLAARGYPADSIAKIMGGNHLRIAQTVWK